MDSKTIILFGIFFVFSLFQCSSTQNRFLLPFFHPKYRCKRHCGNDVHERRYCCHTIKVDKCCYTGSYFPPGSIGNYDLSGIRPSTSGQFLGSFKPTNAESTVNSDFLGSFQPTNLGSNSNRFLQQRQATSQKNNKLPYNVNPLVYSWEDLTSFDYQALPQFENLPLITEQLQKDNKVMYSPTNQYSVDPKENPLILGPLWLVNSQGPKSPSVAGDSSSNAVKGNNRISTPPYHTTQTNSNTKIIIPPNSDLNPGNTKIILPPGYTTFNSNTKILIPPNSNINPGKIKILLPPGYTSANSNNKILIPPNSNINPGNTNILLPPAYTTAKSNTKILIPPGYNVETYENTKILLPPGSNENNNVLVSPGHGSQGTTKILVPPGYELQTDGNTKMVLPPGKEASTGSFSGTFSIKSRHPFVHGLQIPVNPNSVPQIKNPNSDMRQPKPNLSTRILIPEGANITAPNGTKILTPGSNISLKGSLMTKDVKTKREKRSLHNLSFLGGQGSYGGSGSFGGKEEPSFGGSGIFGGQSNSETYGGSGTFGGSSGSESFGGIGSFGGSQSTGSPSSFGGSGSFGGSQSTGSSSSFGGSGTFGGSSSGSVGGSGLYKPNSSIVFPPRKNIQAKY